MAEFTLTMEDVQELDIRGGQLLSVAKSSTYQNLAKKHDFDTTQCLLWFDTIQLLEYVAGHFEHEDVEISFEELGKVVNKIFQSKKSKFPFLTQLLNSGDLWEDEVLGNTIHEIVEDINELYLAIKEDLKKVFATQEDINRIVDSS